MIALIILIDYYTDLDIFYKVTTMKVSSILVSLGLAFGMITMVQATPTYTVKMANASPVQLQQAIETDYVIIRKTDGTPGFVDDRIDPDVQYDLLMAH